MVGTHSTLVYRTAAEQIERFTEFFANALFITVFGMMTFPLIYTAVNFYFLGSGRDSFFVFFPSWFVYANID